MSSLLTVAVAALWLAPWAAAGDTTWTLAGTGIAGDSGDGGQAREAAIDQPRAVSATPAGGYAWAEPYSHRTRIVDQHGVITTLAGTGVAGFSGDGGPATDAKVNFVHTAAPTVDGGFLLADTLNARIRKVSSAGIITTVAGTGAQGYAGDGGPANKAQINNPRSVVPLPDGGFLIPDSNNHRIRRVSPSGIITTVAGTGVQGFSGDGGPAISAQLSIPFAVAPTTDGGFLIADIGNERIRKVSAGGIMSTVAGNGVTGFGGDGGPATSASLHHPHGVVALADGGFVISDTTNERVRLVDPAGIITTVVGTGVRGYSGDGGPSAAAQVAAPKGLSVTSAGDILIADEQNSRIRFVGSVGAPASTILPVISGAAAVDKRLVAAAGGWSGTGPLISYQWQRCTARCANVAGANASTYTPGAADIGARLRIAVTASNPAGTATAFSPQTPGIGASAGSPTKPSAPAQPKSGQPVTTSPPGAKSSAGKEKTLRLRWVVQARKSSVVAGEYVVGARNTRLADAIRAYGKPTCRVVKSDRVVTTWAKRGIWIDNRARRPLRRGTTGCSSPASIHVSQIRLTDRRWTTSLGLRVGDSTARLRKLYPGARYRKIARRGQYNLVWRHTACVTACTPRQKRYGVDAPRLIAQVENGRVIALWVPVAGR